MRSLFGSLHTPSSFHPMTRRPPGRGSRLAGLLFFFVCLLGGLGQAASLAWPLRDWAPPGFAPGQPSGGLQIASLALLVFALQFATRVGQAMWRGWVFGTAWLAGTFWWLFVSLHTYGGLPAWMAALAVFALAGALALYYAFAVGFLCAWAPLSRSAQALLFAGLWTIAELARGEFFTGFPWGAGGYAQVDLMAPWAPLVGVYGMGFLAAVLAYVLASLLTAVVHRVLAWLRQPVRPVGTRPTGGVYVTTPKTGLQLRSLSWWRLAGGAISACVVAALLVSLLGGGERWRNLGQAKTASTGPLRVWLLQGNIPQDQKFVPGTGVAQALDWYPRQMLEGVAAAAAGQGPQLVVAPETALPLLPGQIDPAFWRGLLRPLAEQAGAQPVAVLTGLPLGSYEAGYTNSAWGITPAAARRALSDPQAGEVHRYDKHHLVPFGEFIPPLFRWFTQMMNIPLGDFARGELPQPPWIWAGQRIAPNICYEDLFGEEIAAAFESAENAPTVLVNLSNIGWFGDTVAIDQHLQISRLRALEFGRPMLRATNTGATAAIDHRGVVTHALPRLERGRLEATVEGRSGLTPYAEWASRWGLNPLWLVCGMLVLAIASLRNLGRRGGRTRRR
ncbi:apolipoprotein N-acyltransferase [Hydrogenophaga sp.]|uniref:apolipoprotein N-acyltransferase n=1 Tax=Hydrogenophaga sp. TaxID=1904254 RepID=UPI00257F76A4|nr:apolipoprotein N-acyltransferase [Hydrogenophaga sp.]